MSVDKLQVPQLSVITTPLEKGDGDGYDDSDTVALSTPSPTADSIQDTGSGTERAAFEFTPSPQGVETEFFKPTPAADKTSTAIKKVLKEHLVSVDDDEIVVSSTSVSLPELEDDVHDVQCTPRSVSEGSSSSADSNGGSPFGFTSPRNISPSEMVQYKMLYQSVNAIASPIHAKDYVHVGPERAVFFHTESLGIKLSRHADGYVRVLSVTPYRSTNNEKVRVGEIYAGDIVREVSDVNLRTPIDSAVWKMTIGLIKMAPRPLKFVVAREMHADVEEGAGMGEAGGIANNPIQAIGSQVSQNDVMQNIDSRFGPTREVHFLESCLGVKLHHTPEGYAQILSVTPYQPFPNSPMTRTGDIRAGDVVLEVGGVWNLRDPIDQEGWYALVRYIRETRRPLCMVLADGQSMESILTALEEKEESQRDGDDSTTEGVKSGDGEDELEETSGKSNNMCSAKAAEDSESCDQEGKNGEHIPNDLDQPSVSCVQPKDNISSEQECDASLRADFEYNGYESSDSEENQADEPDVCSNELVIDSSCQDDPKDNDANSNSGQQNDDVYVLNEHLSTSFD